MGRFVKHEPVRLTLSDGDYLDVKKRLTHGEQEDMFARMSPYSIPGLPMQMDRKEIRTAKVLAYLLGWSFTDEDKDGKPIPVPYSPMLPESERVDTLRALSAADFQQIYEAINTHETVVEAALEALKKTKVGGAPIAETSPSPPAADGPSTKSAT